MFRKKYLLSIEEVQSTIEFLEKQEFSGIYTWLCQYKFLEELALSKAKFSLINISEATFLLNKINIFKKIISKFNAIFDKTLDKNSMVEMKVLNGEHKGKIIILHSSYFNIIN